MTDATKQKFEQMIEELTTLDELDEVRTLIDYRANEVEDLEDDSDTPLEDDE